MLQPKMSSIYRSITSSGVWLSVLLAACTPLPCDLDGDGMCPPADCNDADPNDGGCSPNPGGTATPSPALTPTRPPVGTPTAAPTAAPTGTPTDAPTGTPAHSQPPEPTLMQTGTPANTPEHSPVPTSPPEASETPAPTATPEPVPCTDADDDHACAGVGPSADCNDDDPRIYPGAPERCNAEDDNCDGIVDTPELKYWYRDVDGDGFGVEADHTIGTCLTVAGYSLARGDCDDSDTGTHPGAPDSDGDGIDQDCGGTDALEPSVGLEASTFVDLQAAIDATSPGTILWVGPGQYPVLALSLKGKTFVLRSTHREDETILDAERLGQILLIEQGSSAGTEVDGFTLTRGYSNDYNATDFPGIAVDMTQAEALLRNLHVTDNHVEFGYIAKVEFSRLSADNLVVNENWAAQGVALEMFYSGGTLDHLAVFNNDAPGLSVSNWSSSNSPVKIRHSTIAYNRSEDNTAGLSLYCGGAAEITDTILAENGPLNYLSYCNGGDEIANLPAVISFSSHHNRVGRQQEVGPSSELLMFTDPQFLVAPGSLPESVADLRLRPGSKLRDAGTEGEQDPDGSRIDIGYYGGPNADWRVYFDDDQDGLFDDWEWRHGLDSTLPDDSHDADGDGLDNAAELANALLPDLPDMDGDGYLDGEELEQDRDPFNRFSQPGIEGLVTIRVPEDYPTLKAAIDAITLDGVIQLTSFSLEEPILMRGKDITLRSSTQAIADIELGTMAQLRVIQGTLTLEDLRLKPFAIDQATAFPDSVLRLTGANTQLHNVSIEGIRSTTPLIVSTSSTLDATVLSLMGNEYQYGYGDMLSFTNTDISLHQLRLTGNRNGSVYLAGSKAIFSQCVMTENENESYLVSAAMNSDVTMVNCNLSYNMGLAIRNYTSKMSLLNSLIAKNLSVGLGGYSGPGVGGVLHSNGALNIVNSIIAYNSGSNLSVSSDSDLAQVSLAYSVLYSPVAPYHNLSSLPATVLEVDPLFMRRTPLLDHSDDFHLRPTSPLKDAGDPSSTDPDGTRADIGLYGGPASDFSGYQDDDHDGLYDDWEAQFGLDPMRSNALEDPDSDGLSNSVELNNGLNPTLADTDGDTALDGVEISANTDPLNPCKVPGSEALRPIHVPEDYPTVQDAINAIPDEGTILIAPGVYTENHGIFFQTLALEGTDGPLSTILEGAGLRTLTVMQSTVSLHGLTIQGGNAIHGGGLLLSYADGELSSLILQQNHADILGGGSRINASNVNMKHSVIRQNEAMSNDTGFGGGVSAQSSQSVFQNVLFEDNVAYKYGGAMCHTGDSTRLNQCTVINNSTSLPPAGGGIVYAASGLEIDNSILAYNYGGNVVYFQLSGALPPSLRYTDLYNPSGYLGSVVGFVPDPSNPTNEPGFLHYSADGSPSSAHLSSRSRLINVGDPSVCSSFDGSGCDADGSRADLGMYGGAAGAAWDMDADGLPDWFWPGDWSSAPAPFSSTDYDCDDWNPTSASCESIADPARVSFTSLQGAAWH